MTLPAFHYRRPTTLEEAFDAARTEAGSRWLAGGMSLLPLMKMQLAAPDTLVDLAGVEDLTGMREDEGHLTVGAMTSHHQMALDARVARWAPLAAEAARVIGDPQVRWRGTIGGSLAHADPAADMPAAVLASEAELEAASPRGRRRIAADRFFLGPLTTALEPDEMLTAVHFPKDTAGWRHRYVKHAHPASGYAVVGVALLLAMDGGRVEHARIAVTGMAGHAFRARSAESILTGQRLTDAIIQEAAHSVVDGEEPVGDVYASAPFRAHLAQVMTGRALAEWEAPG